MGDRRDARGLRHCRVAQTFAGETGHGDFRDQSRSQPWRKRLLLRDSRSRARGSTASYSVDGDVALFEEKRSAIRKLRAGGKGGRRACFEGRITGSGAAQRERAGAVERRSTIHAAIAENHAQSIERRKRSARPQLLLAVRTENRQRR